MINHCLQFVVAIALFFCSPQCLSTSTISYHLFTVYCFHFLCLWFVINTLVSGPLTKLQPISKLVSVMLKCGMSVQRKTGISDQDALRNCLGRTGQNIIDGA